MKKQKQIVTLIVCLLCTVTSIFLLLMSGDSSIQGGKGDGENYQVNTIEDVKSVLRDLIYEFDNMRIFDNDAETVAVASVDSRRRGTSATIKGSGSFIEKIDIPATGEDAYLDMNYDTVFYYSSDGQLLINCEMSMVVDINAGANSQYINVSANYDMYYDRSGKSYIKFNKYTGLPIQLLNKWIEISSFSDFSVAYIGMDLDSFATSDLLRFKQWFELIEKYLDEYENDIVIHRNDLYSFSGSVLELMAGEIFNLNQDTWGTVIELPSLEIEDLNGEFNIDLSNEESPRFVLDIEKGIYSAVIDGYSVKYDVSEYEEIEITNIDNTVVDVKNLEAYDIYELLDIMFEE